MLTTNVIPFILIDVFLCERVMQCLHDCLHREELKKCKERIEQLEEERDQVFKDIQNAEAEQNT